MIDFDIRRRRTNAIDDKPASICRRRNQTGRNTPGRTARMSLLIDSGNGRTTSNATARLNYSFLIVTQTDTKSASSSSSLTFIAHRFQTLTIRINCFLHEVDSQLFKSMLNSQHCINCLLTHTRNTAYTLWGEETTRMNSHIIIITCLGVPLSTGPSTILFDVFFNFYIRPTLNWYIINVHILMYVHIRFVVYT